MMKEKLSPLALSVCLDMIVSDETNMVYTLFTRIDFFTPKQLRWFKRLLPHFLTDT